MKDHRFKRMCIIILSVMNCSSLFCSCCMPNVLISEKNKIVLSHLTLTPGCSIVSTDLSTMEPDFYNTHEYTSFNVINLSMHIFGGRAFYLFFFWSSVSSLIYLVEVPSIKLYSFVIQNRGFVLIIATPCLQAHFTEESASSRHLRRSFSLAILWRKISRASK